MPYMWDNNNPVAYSDPSGYCTTADGTSDHTHKYCTIVTEKSCTHPSGPPCGDFTKGEVNTVNGAAASISAMDMAMGFFVPGGEEVMLQKRWHAADLRQYELVKPAKPPSEQLTILALR